MSPVKPFPIDYPVDLEPVRSQVLNVLKDDKHECSRIRSCRYKSYCHSSYCPHCLRMNGYRLKDQIVSGASSIPGPRLRFATLTTRDVPLDALRDTGREIVQAGRRAFKALNVAGYVARLELAGGKVQREHKMLEGLGRVRDVRQGPDGLLYLLTDLDKGRLLRVLPG